MEITERLLNDAGGWQTMKQARALQEMGRVAGVTWEEPLLQGRVREGETEFRSGLRILSKSNIENLCTCRASRQHGAICAHSVAVGLEFLKPAAGPQRAVSALGVDGATPSTPAVAATGAAIAKPVFSAEQGEPVEIHVILPPNLASAWQRGSVMVGLEALWAGKRLLLSALPKSGAFRANEADRRLIDQARALAGGETPGMLSLNREQFLSLLDALREHAGVTFGKATRAVIGGQGIRPKLDFERKPDGALRLSVERPAGAELLAAGGRAWLLQGETLCEWAPGLPAAYRTLLEGGQTLAEEHAAGFLQRELPNLRPFFEMDESAVPSATVSAPNAPAVVLALDLEGSLNHLVGKLTASYGDRRIVLSQPPQRAGFARDPAAEYAAVERLRSGGFTGPDAEGQFVLKGEQRILAFFARDLPAWEKAAKVTIGSRFAHVTRDVERVQPRLEIRSSGERWFEVQVELGSESGERFEAAEIQRLLQSGQSHVKRKNGKIAVFDPAMLDDFQQVLTDCQPNQRQPGLYHLDRRHAGYLDAVATDHGFHVTAPAQWSRAALGSKELAAQAPVPLGSLEGTLRPYQKHGVTWLNTLARNGFAGILADEMGLGKTVQTLAALRHLGGQALIVCPSSLVYNWCREAAKFTPERQVLAIEGPERRRLFGEPFAKADLVVTSYALLRRDAELYRDREFKVAVLDEAQHIKNPESQNAQAAFSVRAQHRFALTGTPVENSVRDLWSLMNFLMPGYLGSRNDFKERYEQPIATTPGGPEHARLVKRLRPFVLRRKKRDVLNELPDKIEQVTYCDLGRPQREMYTALLAAARRQALDASGLPDQNKARMQILTALLRLRQACCDLRLLQPEATGETEELSGKVETLNELLLEAVDGGHKVLVFSQFVSMLKLLRAHLEKAEIGTCYLDGSTKNRAAEVDRFQTGEVPVFLISLKAGGVGLNLTAADTVVHFDPWWNPAVEAQATDRAHRIGQRNVVTSYKLIARDTIEEKILSLQEKKRKVIEATIESEEPLMQGLTMTDLQELLE
ncbi:MAG TPA: SNF2-related protein [Chthoniobacteraceae bacterium]|nr:SNF2-related protein [Chthoniobacteraceae bacterium]